MIEIGLGEKEKIIGNSECKQLLWGLPGNGMEIIRSIGELLFYFSMLFTKGEITLCLCADNPLKSNILLHRKEEMLEQYLE